MRLRKGIDKQKGTFVVTSPKVLVVEDSASSSLFITHALQKAGYRVITAVDGNEGLTKALQEWPECLILDVVLPGVSGFGVCRQLRSIDPQRSLSIIMVSNKNTQLDQSWGLRQGADRYLPKPFTEEALVRTVEEVLTTKHF